ncbi:Uncharacterised protein [Mycobacteroides abscessus subsp. massiliense]|nr:Uncharacterised protein [Mycobacteroides abscessus subsp. massiliense]
MVGFDHQHLGVHPGRREVTFCRSVSDLRRHIVGHVLAVVISRCITGQGEQTDQGNATRDHQNGPGPTHYGRAYAPPSAFVILTLGLEQPKTAT